MVADVLWMKRLGMGGVVILLLILLAVAALPLWFPWATGAALNRLGVEYASYERVGYGRLALKEVRYFQEGLEVEAKRVEAFGPTGWLWNLTRGLDAVDYLTVSDWRVTLEEAEEAIVRPEDEDRDKVISIYDIFSDVEGFLPMVVRWVPRASLGSGTVQVADRVIEVAGAEWHQGRLAAEVLDRRLGQTILFAGDVGQGLPFSLEGNLDPFPFSIVLSLSRVEDFLAVRSEASLAGNLLVAEAEFPREGYLPETARFRSDNFRLPAGYLDFEGYQDIRGSLLMEWKEGLFGVNLIGQADPVRDWASRLPPLRIEASVRGDLESLVVEELEIRSPWLVANLSDPVAVSYSGELLSDTSFFAVAADLSKQPFVDLEGLLQGGIRISPGEELVPLIDFNLEVADLAGFELELARVEVNGRLKWPELGVAAAVIEGPDGSLVTASAVMDLDTMEISAGRIEGTAQSAMVAPWMPETVGFTTASLTGQFEGPVGALRHEGSVSVEAITAPGTHLMQGRINWKGEQENLSDFALDLMAGEGRLQVEGATRLGEESFELFLGSVWLGREGKTLLQSVGPSLLVADWKGLGIALSLDELLWTHEERLIRLSAELSWPERGWFSVDLRDLETDLVGDFFAVDTDFFRLLEASLSGSWDEGPINFEVLADIRVELEEDQIQVGMDITGDGDELRVSQLRASTQGKSLVSAEGRLPVSVWPGRDAILQIQEEGEIDFRARTEPGAPFWNRLGDLTGIHLEDPKLSLLVSGTPVAPRGHLIGASPALVLRALDTGEGGPSLQFTNLTIRTLFDVEKLFLEELSLDVEGQRVEAEATLPMGTKEWQALVRQGRIPEWERLFGRLTVPEARVAAFTRFAPTILSPQGVLEADIAILPGGQLDGLLTLKNAATRPIMPLGAIRDGTARVVFRERTAYLEEISAAIGGERVALTGRIDLPFEQPLAFNVAMKGSNLPLARQPGVVIRGDLDLLARSEGGAVPTLSGRVDLRDSFYVAHLRLMPGGGVATPDRRPPFFSIEQKPFADWRLNVDIRGPGFLNIRGPIFQGELSSTFSLSGTLEEPRAIGAASIDEGRVRFPFASMSIDQGEIALRREDPFTPQLFIVASGQAFGYDITMEITGTAETPAIEFISNPPLSSEQTLLMVTTGELPREEIRFTTQQRASRFAIYFGRNLLYELTGDDAAGDRLTIRSGEQVSEGGRETMAIEFRLTDRWSVTGEYDRFDEYNAGLKWNIFSR
jgi:translocation and assembly module TamB